ncbi:MAG TPA: hydroxyacid dehydrogenase [bacterium]|nr:hydroxyacid dehydrogenase [bacterium]
MTERFRVFITEPRTHPAVARLQEIADVQQGPPARRMDEHELSDALQDVHAVLITSRDRVTGAMIEQAMRLRVIGKFGARPENVDWDAARRRGVRILWAPEANSDSVAEYTVLLVLAHLRHVVQAVHHLRGGGWRDTFQPGRELRGQTVGLVGLGNVGARVARCLGGFGVTLLGSDPAVSRERAAEMGVCLVALPELLAQSDVVSLHAMVTPETRHMIDASALRRMKPNALLVNTARGALVDEDALARALTQGRIGGACLDVFAAEPVTASHPFVGAPRTIASPHIAAQTVEAQDREVTQTIEDVMRVLNGGEPVYSPGA